jgi:hypothetical protein
MKKIIRTDKMSRVTKTSKVHPGIKVSEDATENKPKPYLGYRAGCGMPSAYPPVESYSEKAAKIYNKVFGHEGDIKVANIKGVERCGKWTCEYYSRRASSQCVMYLDAKKCKIHRKRKKNGLDKSKRQKA